jgi:hypothetical protein
MSKGQFKGEEQKGRVRKKETEKPEGSQPKSAEMPPISRLQQQVGNQAVQRLVQRRGGEGAFELDDETAARIHGARGGGRPLDEKAGEEIGGALGTDLGDVRVHTSPESDALNRDLGAKAFTTGKDIFFRDGEYDPGSSAGKELLAHELTHVAQQGSGAVGSGGGKMTVNDPNDAFESQADGVAKAVTSQATGQAQRMPEEAAGLQLQPMDEEEEELQMQEMEEEEEEVQMQDMPEEEEELQMQEEEEEELQMQEDEEEEEALL